MRQRATSRVQRWASWWLQMHPLSQAWMCPTATLATMAFGPCLKLFRATPTCRS